MRCEAVLYSDRQPHSFFDMLVTRFNSLNLDFYKIQKMIQDYHPGNLENLVKIKVQTINKACKQ
jgi:hypothetical protein